MQLSLVFDKTEFASEQKKYSSLATSRAVVSKTDTAKQYIAVTIHKTGPKSMTQKTDENFKTLKKSRMQKSRQANK